MTCCSRGLALSAPATNEVTPINHAVLSYGLGVDSTAILLRWMLEPSSRPCPLVNVTVIVSMTGDEFEDTGRDVTAYILPLLREHSVRLVQVARHGSKEADGITILSDTRKPEMLYLKGDYKLSDELASSGVVPSYSGIHKCSLKAKAFVIESWLDNYYDNSAFGHAFGYSADEPKRVEKSEAASRARNVAFGFNAEELGRVEKAKLYDHAQRRAFYPLVEWGWTRQNCQDYIAETLGISWKKSACVYCPFAHNKQNLVPLQARHLAHPLQTAEALMLEHMSLALNPRGSLYRAETLMTMTMRADNSLALNEFRSMRDGGQWAIYRVRRIYGVKAGSAEPKKGTVQRAVEKVRLFETQAEALNSLESDAAEHGWAVVVANYLHYAYVEHRADTYPSREEYYVVAPARVESKTRYGIEAFDSQWRPTQFGISFPVGE